ncbi:MAG: homoserine dehydrogenase [bacterium]|nr:homoserine dehydrogenase [bacterium]
MSKTINIGLIGLGTVGGGVVSVLRDNLNLIEARIEALVRLKKVCDLDLDRARKLGLNSEQLTARAEEVVTDPEIDIVIELIGGYEPARTFILEAIRHGKQVVTANKALLAKYWGEVMSAAAEYRVGLGFEASVGGGIPLLSSIRTGLAANRIESIFGIINGTCNYILTVMESQGKEFNEVLAEAQAEGYAEADPSFDIEGIDTAHKIIILASLAFGQWVKMEEVYTEGIIRLTRADITCAKEFGYTLKLLGIAREEKSELDVRVHPVLIPNHHPLAAVDGVYNAVYCQGSLTGPLLFYGQGAGRFPTASAVVADCIALARDLLAGQVRLPWRPGDKPKIVKGIKSAKTRYYIRFSALDQPGVLAEISGILGRHRISIASVIQKERGTKDSVPVIMLTHEALEKDMQAALSQIDQLPVIKDKSLIIRIEEL